MLVEVLSVTKPCRHAQLYTSKRVGEGDVILQDPTADALHDPANYVNFKPSDLARLRERCRKGQKTDAR